MKVSNIDDTVDFEKDVASNVKNLGNDEKLKTASLNWLHNTSQYKYTYNFK